MRTGLAATAAIVALGGLVSACGATTTGAQPTGTRPTTSASAPGHGATSPAATPAPAPSTGAAQADCTGSVSTPTMGGPHQLRAIQFVTPQTGWVAGRDRILGTTDGGAHWRVQYLTTPAAELATIDFVDASHGWVTGPGTLLATSDGGARWTRLPLPCAPLRSVHFVSPQTGYAVAGSVPARAGLPSPGGIVLKTTDGGLTWSRMSTPRAAQSVCFTGSSHGWLGADGSVYGTADGGATWTLALADPYKSVGQGIASYAAVQCAGPAAAWAVITGPGAGMSHEPYVALHSSGATWSPVFDELYMAAPGVHTKVNAPGPEPGPFSAVSADQALFAGYCGPCSPPRPVSAGEDQGGTTAMGLATGGGARFGPARDISGLSMASGMAFLTASDGWVVGDLNVYPTSGKGKVPQPVSRVLHTTDGGLTWQVQYSV